ncbi:MAG: hypothetical protein ACFFAO_17365 [Candidatus Hermodarchaeota archaeon]
MTSEFVEDKDGMKLRKLVELKTDTAKEYQDAMIGRVEYFKKKNQEKSQFNSFIQNTIINSLCTILNFKQNIDKAIGEENLKKVHEVIDNILLFGL